MVQYLIKQGSVMLSTALFVILILLKLSNEP
jgi:hypothetical protein